MTAMMIQLDDELAAQLRNLAAVQDRPEPDIVREALAAYIQNGRPLPKGMGNYRSGQTTVSAEARDILRQSAKEGTWP